MNYASLYVRWAVWGLESLDLKGPLVYVVMSEEGNQDLNNSVTFDKFYALLRALLKVILSDMGCLDLNLQISGLHHRSWWKYLNYENLSPFWQFGLISCITNLIFSFFFFFSFFSWANWFTVHISRSCWEMG